MISNSLSKMLLRVGKNSHNMQKKKKKLHHDHIPFTVKRIGSIVFSVWTGKPPPTDLQLFERLASLGISGAQ